MSDTLDKLPLNTLIGMVGADLKTPPIDVSDEGVDALLRHDPLASAEDFTGKSMGPETLGSGLAFVQMHGARKDAVLTERGDTTFSNKLDRYVDIITGYGFELAGEFPFKSRMWDYDEIMFVYVHRGYGLVLCFDTHGGKKEDGYSVNGGKVYYNWVPNADLNYWSCTSSGGFHFDEDDVKTWTGDHDCREALIFNMERLRKNGTFLPKWRANPFLWFLHHDDTYNEPYQTARKEWLAGDRSTECPQDRDFPEGKYDYDAINRERIAQMPLVQAIIQPYKGGLE